MQRFYVSIVPIVAVMLAGSPVSAQSVAYERYQLDNGLTVILHQNQAVPLVAVNLWYYVGAKDEPAQRSGFAHLFEHLMFMGTERVPGLDFDNIMEAGGGYNNATTSADRTNYFETGPSSLLPTLLWLEADRLEDLGRMMTQDKLDRQREVVRNERRQSYENRPYGRADLKVSGLMYPEGHPYHIPVIGTHADLEAATVEDVKNFFKTYYVPSNAALVVAGDFDADETKTLIQRMFGTLPRGDDVTHARAVPVQLDGIRRLTVTDQVQYPRVTMVYHSPAQYAPGDAEMDLAASVLADGISSRLYQRLVYQDELAVEVSAYQASQLLGSLFYIEATVRPEVDLAVVERAVDDAVSEFARMGPTAEELQRQVAAVETRTVSRLQSILRVADSLNAYQFHFGEPDSFARDLDRYRKATTEDVRRWSQRVLAPQTRLIMRVVPRRPVPQVNPRDVRPAPMAARAFNVQEPTSFELSNGIAVAHWHRPDLPMMALTLKLNRGAQCDEAAQGGRAHLIAEMLEQGAGDLDAVEFANALDLIGATISADTQHESTTVHLSALSRHFAAGVALFSDAVQRPKFDAKEWSRIQRLHIASLQQQRDNPVRVAARVSMKTFFGEAHPFGRAISGSPECVAALNVEQLVAGHRQIFRPEAAAIFVAGSLDATETQSVLESAFGEWAVPEGQPLPKVTYPAPANDQLRVAIVDKPNAVQTVIRFTMPAPAYNTPDRNKLLSLNTILGGSFTSRLNKNLREDHGYTYGARSRFFLGPRCGYFYASSSVRADVTGPALAEFLKEFRGIRNGTVSSAEADKARSSRRTGLVESLATLDGVIDTAVELSDHGRPISALNADATAIAGVTADQLNSLSHSAIPLESGLLVLVGDRKAILRQISGLDLPTPIELDETGKIK
jgi:predicted Zn-dependent peptidase